MNAETFKQLIQDFGLTGKEAAKALGVHRRTLQAYANGKYPVPDMLAVVLRLIEAERLSFEELSDLAQ